MGPQFSCFRRWLIVLLSGLFLFQIGAVIWAAQYLDDPPIDLSLPPEWQLGLGIFWAGLSGLGIMKLWKVTPGWEFRSLWLIAGFIGYSGLRLAVFSRAEYDRQRLPFVMFLVVLLLVIVLVTQFVWRKLRGRNIGEIE